MRLVLGWELHGRSDLSKRGVHELISSRQNSSGLTEFAGTGLIFSNVTGFGCSTTVVVVVAGAGATKLGCIVVVTGCSCTVLGICK